MTGCLAFAAAPSALAQPARAKRVAWLTNGSPATHAELLAAFRAAMRERGWREGDNLILDVRWGEGRADRLPSLAEEIVRLRPDVVVTAANVVHVAMHRATSTIPIVMMTGSDPIGSGLAQSLARPGGNVTGVTGAFDAIPPKMLEMAAALLPARGRVAVLVDETMALREKMVRELEGAAAGRPLHFVRVGAPDEALARVRALGAQRPDALIVLPGSMVFALGERLVREAASLAIPVIYPFEEFVELGGLASYSPDLLDNYRRSARYVDLILRGAAPGGLAIEQPLSLRLTVNMRTAKALGIAIPRTIAMRADRVIE